MSVEFHFYNPWEYAGEGTQEFWSDEAGLRWMFDRAQQEWGNTGLGVVIGEWGVTDHGSAAKLDEVRQNISYYCKTYVSEAGKRGFSSFVWDNNSFGQGADKFGIFERWKNMKVRATWTMEGILAGMAEIGK